MKKQDITRYTENELDLIVQNDEYLYNEFNRAVQREKIEPFIEELKEYFVFTEEQADTLRNAYE